MGGRLIILPKPNKKNIIRYSDIIANKIKEVGAYNCVHSHSLFFNGIVLKGAYKAGVPIRISHSHSTSDGKINNLFRKIYKSFMRNNILKYSTDLFGCSLEACGYLYGTYSDNRIRVVNNGIELDKFKGVPCSDNLLKNELKLPQECVLLGHVGRFTEVKNHKFIIEIFTYLIEYEHRARLILVGDGPLKHEIKELIKNKGLDNYVYLLGIRDDVPKLIGSLDVFILPSLYEGVPLVLVEAQAAGIPCVVSDTVTDTIDLKIGLVDYLSLQDDISIWIETIVSKINKEKVDWSIREKAIKSNGYDIIDISKDLQKIYLRNYT